LVTGATGFTGGAVCERLRANGADVVAFVRSSSNVEKLAQLGIETRAVDIGDAADVRRNFGDIDMVYHIAAAYRSEHASHDEFFRVNVEGTRNLLDAALEARVRRFVHCSTVGVQGEIQDPPATEDYRARPGDHYQESKLQGELLALQYFRERGLSGSVVRPVGIYGPGDTRFLKLFRSIARGRFVMIGSGEVLYHMTYIDDLVSGFLLAGTKPEAAGEVFTIGGPIYTTLNVLVEKIAGILSVKVPSLRLPLAPVYAAAVVCDRVCRAVGVSPPLYPRRVEFFHLDRAFSIDKAKRLLGYQPQYSLDDGLAQTASWYKQNGFL
jgi:nucleoside-diphosphate-sugar epimerase